MPAPVPPSAAAVPAARIEALRAFSRFYTQRLGMLGEHLLASRFTLPEARVLWELAHADGTTASALTRALDLDAGYLSRLLRRLRDLGLVKARRSPRDARQTLLALSAAGRRAFAPLDRASQRQMQALLAPLPEAAQRQVLESTNRVRALLGDTGPRAFSLRTHEPGDIGWIVQRHGALYWQEYRWDARFEALVARIGADLIEHFDAAHEACWIAERDGVPLGCVCLVRARDPTSLRVVPGVAQLRLLLVEPAARGQGIGKVLTAECERFARAAGYRRIRLWTNSVLLAARGIYAAAGYRLVASEPHRSFGQQLIGETWELELT